MNFGLLRHRIEIQEHTEVRGDSGQVVRGWTTVVAWWASVDPLSGRELQYAQQIHADARVRIRMRPYDGLTPDHRIKFGTRHYNILDVRDMDERGEVAECMCVEVKGG